MTASHVRTSSLDLFARARAENIPSIHVHENLLHTQLSQAMKVSARASNCNSPRSASFACSPVANSTKPHLHTPNCTSNPQACFFSLTISQSAWPPRQSKSTVAYHMLLYAARQITFLPTLLLHVQPSSKHAQEAASSWPSCVGGHSTCTSALVGWDVCRHARCQPSCLLGIESGFASGCTTGYWLLVLPRCCGWRDTFR